MVTDLRTVCSKSGKLRFFAIQILREINFWYLKGVSNCLSVNFLALNYLDWLICAIFKC